MTEAMRQTMGVSRAYFQYHWSRETIHRGETLHRDAPKFFELIDGVSGMPATALWTAPSRDDGDENQGDVTRDLKRLDRFLNTGLQ